MSEEQQPPRLGEHGENKSAYRSPETFGVSAAFEAHSANVLAVSVQQHVSTAVFSAAEIAALRAADPEATSLWYKLIERQQSHDHALELQTLRSESFYRILGISTALVVILAMSAVTALALFKGFPATAAVLGATTGVATVAGAFIRGRNLSPSAQAANQAPSEAAYPTQKVPTSAPSPPR